MLVELYRVSNGMTTNQKYANVSCVYKMTLNKAGETTIGATPGRGSEGNTNQGGQPRPGVFTSRVICTSLIDNG